MNRDQFWLTDEQRSKIKLHLPTNTRGEGRDDLRSVFHSIVHVPKSGGHPVERLRTTDRRRRSIANRP